MHRQFEPCRSSRQGGAVDPSRTTRAATPEEPTERARVPLTSFAAVKRCLRFAIGSSFPVALLLAPRQLRRATGRRRRRPAPARGPLPPGEPDREGRRERKLATEKRTAASADGLRGDRAAAGAPPRRPPPRRARPWPSVFLPPPHRCPGGRGPTRRRGYLQGPSFGARIVQVPPAEQQEAAAGPSRSTHPCWNCEPERTEGSLLYVSCFDGADRGASSARRRRSGEDEK
jgi:hypothetical protein